MQIELCTSERLKRLTTGQPYEEHFLQSYL